MFSHRMDRERRQRWLEMIELRTDKYCPFELLEDKTALSSEIVTLGDPVQSFGSKMPKSGLLAGTGSSAPETGTLFPFMAQRLARLQAEFKSENSEGRDSWIRGDRYGEAQGEALAALFPESVTPWDPLELLVGIKVPKSGVKHVFTGASASAPETALGLMAEFKEPKEWSFPELIVPKFRTFSNPKLQRFREQFGSKEVKLDPDAVYREYTLPALEVYPEYTCMPEEEISKHFGRPGVLFNALPGSFIRGRCKGAFTTCSFASTLGAVGAIAPETARDGYMQAAGSSKSDTSNFWFGVVACVGVLVAFIGVVVAIMQLRRSRRTHTATAAPTQQMLTMQRRSRVQYIVEEETVHRIDEMA